MICLPVVSYKPVGNIAGDPRLAGYITLQFPFSRKKILISFFQAKDLCTSYKFVQDLSMLCLRQESVTFVKVKYCAVPPGVRARSEPGGTR